MAKVVVYALVAIAFVALIILSPTNTYSSHNQHGVHALSRRLGYKLPISNLDPIVRKLQRVSEETGLVEENNSINLERISVDVSDAEVPNEYFSNDGKLNITRRLIFLFSLIDNAPKDGKASFEEFQIWNREQTVDTLTYRTKQALDLHDKNKDGEISFSEFLPQFSKEEIEQNAMFNGGAGWWMEQFRNADIDKNNILNFDEFNNFLYPEDSNNEEIQKWLIRERLRMMDDDRDGKLNLAEFSLHVYGIFKVYAEVESRRVALVSAERKFEELDTDKDQFLDVKELIPVLNYIKPGELFYAKFYASHMIQQADDNEDGYLTLEEMINHEDLFYNIVYGKSIERYKDVDEEL